MMTPAPPVFNAKTLRAACVIATVTALLFGCSSPSENLNAMTPSRQVAKETDGLVTGVVLDVEGELSEGRGGVRMDLRPDLTKLKQEQKQEREIKLPDPIINIKRRGGIVPIEGGGTLLIGGQRLAPAQAEPEPQSRNSTCLTWRLGALAAWRLDWKEVGAC